MGAGLYSEASLIQKVFRSFPKGFLFLFCLWVFFCLFLFFVPIVVQNGHFSKRSVFRQVFISDLSSRAVIWQSLVFILKVFSPKEDFYFMTAYLSERFYIRMVVFSDEILWIMKNSGVMTFRDFIGTSVDCVFEERDFWTENRPQESENDMTPKKQQRKSRELRMQRFYLTISDILHVTHFISHFYTDEHFKLTKGSKLFLHFENSLLFYVFHNFKIAI